MAINGESLMALRDAIKDAYTSKEATTFEAVVVSTSDGISVQAGDQAPFVVEATTAGVSVGDVVRVTVKDGKATIEGNVSDPSAGASIVKKMRDSVDFVLETTRGFAVSIAEAAKGATNFMRFTGDGLEIGNFDEGEGSWQGSRTRITKSAFQVVVDSILASFGVEPKPHWNNFNGEWEDKDCAVMESPALPAFSGVDGTVAGDERGRINPRRMTSGTFAENAYYENSREGVVRQSSTASLQSVAYLEPGEEGYVDGGRNIAASAGVECVTVKQVDEAGTETKEGHVNLRGDDVSAENFVFSTKNPGGYRTDQWGNFTHTNATKSNTWNINNNAGQPVFRVGLETGQVDSKVASGRISANSGWKVAEGGYVYRVGNIVFLSLTDMQATSAHTSSSDNTKVANIPSGYKPVQRLRTACGASGHYKGMFQVSTDGSVYISHISNGSAFCKFTTNSTNVWFSAAWITQDAWPA